VANEKTKN